MCQGRDVDIHKCRGHFFVSFGICSRIELEKLLSICEVIHTCRLHLKSRMGEQNAVIMRRNEPSRLALIKRCLDDIFLYLPLVTRGLAVRPRHTEVFSSCLKISLLRP